MSSDNQKSSNMESKSRLSQESEAAEKDPRDQQELGTLLKLSVGGTKFTTYQSTLTRYPDSMIGTMFSGRHTLQKDEEGCIFIDRDGRYFGNILNFLRAPEEWSARRLTNGDLYETRKEAAYYGLKDVMFPFVPAPTATLKSNCEYDLIVSQTLDGMWILHGKDATVCSNCGAAYTKTTTTMNYGFIPNFAQSHEVVNANQPKPSAEYPCLCCGAGTAISTATTRAPAITTASATRDVGGPGNAVGTESPL